MNNKFLSILTILIVLFATITFSAPTAIKKITVTSPGKGPWQKGSVQTASWWCNACGTDESVVVKIEQEASTGDITVFSQTTSNAFNGTLNFTIGDWDTSATFYTKVQLSDDPKIFGRGVEFTIKDA